MTRWNARTWVRREAEAIAETYTDDHYTQTIEEQYPFILELLHGDEFEELTDDQRRRAIAVCQLLIREERQERNRDLIRSGKLGPAKLL